MVVGVGIYGWGKVDDYGWRPTPQMSRRRLSVARLVIVWCFPRWSVVHFTLVVVAFLAIIISLRLVVAVGIWWCGVVSIPRFCSAVVVAVRVIFVVLESSPFATDDSDNLVDVFLAC